MKGPSEDRLNTLIHLDVGEKNMGPQSGETVSVSNKDLLQLEQNTSVLEKRLLVCTKGGESLNARCPKRKEPPTTTAMPESNVLARIKSFLPTLNEANDKLFSDIQAHGADSFNIELVPEAEERYVEMDLALGIADLHTPEALAAAELAANGQVLTVDKREDSSECSSSDSDVEDGDSGTNNIGGLLEVILSGGSRPVSRADQQESLKDTSAIQQKKIKLL